MNVIEESPIESEKATSIDPEMCCTLYTFAAELYEGKRPIGVGLVKVSRITSGMPKDWAEWGEAYAKERHIRLLEIASVDCVDERGPGKVWAKYI